MAHRGKVAAVLLPLVLVAALVTAFVVAGADVAVDSDQAPASQSAPRTAAGEAQPPPNAGPPSSAQRSSRAVATALRGPLAHPDLGPVGVVVTDVVTGHVLHAEREDSAVTPASTTKVLTAAAALTRLGPSETLATSVVAGARPGVLTLVGGGDPTLRLSAAEGTYPGAASITALANQVRASGFGPVSRVVVDSSRYQGPLLAPDVPSTWVAGGSIAPMRPVMVNGGRFDPALPPRTWDPDLAAGEALARALGAGDVPVRRSAPPVEPVVLATVESPPVQDLVAYMLLESDNVLAEALGREVALAEGLPASYAGAAAAVSRVTAGLPTQGDAMGVSLVDASGLSPRNQVSPAALAALMSYAARDSGVLTELVDALPVAGVSGTLADRFGPGSGALAGAGSVRAKTGRLPTAAALSGLVESADGRLLAFAFLAGNVPGDPQRASDALDRAAAALARCSSCGG